MAPMEAAPKPGIFLRIPLEIRNQIYEYCIPQNLRFDCRSHGFGYNMYQQNRPQIWYKSPWYAYGRVRAGPPPFDCTHRVSHVRATRRWRGFDGYGDETDEASESGHSRLDTRGVASTSYHDYCYECHNYTLGLPASRKSALPGLLLVCRQITEEAETMLYGRNTFTVDLHHDGLMGRRGGLRRFSPQRRAKMRKLILFLRPMGRCYRPSFCMDPTLWDGILSDTSIVGLVLEQPSPLMWAGRTYEDVFREWAAWLSPILEYMSQVIPQTADIVVDANMEDRTARMVEGTIPGRCRFLQLPAGDYIFRRGQYRFVPQYWPDVQITGHRWKAPIINLHTEHLDTMLEEKGNDFI